MKTRIISAMVGLVILAVVLIFFDTLLLNAVVAFISLIAVHELLKATGITRHPALTAVGISLAAAIPMAQLGVFQRFLPVVFLFVISLFLILFRQHALITIQQVAMTFFFSMIIPLFFVCIVFFRDHYGPQQGLFYVLISLCAAWLCDSGAYFVGRAFGKHKLAPQISPKKTIEGSVGGALVATLLVFPVSLGFQWGMAKLGYNVTVNFLALGITFPLFCIAGMVGDLSLSVIKRQFNVKDYGKIMPGHGGILDRFDSVLFVLPLVYTVCGYWPLVSM
ncbi:phosphatidate cytidylyltransferase [Oscillospiraceae bacterium MB08-C2-2]|nr:phosphatidate cytidylyltransferase [Oscillospiraceae bacterium MB08-C2-2]